MSYIDKGILTSHSDERLYYESRSLKKRDHYKVHFIFIHGALSHGRGQQRFIEHIVAGYPKSIISSFDFSGHGRSSGRKAYTNSLDQYSEELVEFIEFQKKHISADKIVLIGYSMGGLVSLDTLSYQGLNFLYDLLILVNPCLKLNDNILAKGASKFKTMSKGLLGKVRLPVLAPGSSLTNDEQIIEEIESDPLRSSHITVSLFSELYRLAARIRLQSIGAHPPLLFLISGADRTVQPEITRVYAQGFKSSSCEVKYYKYAKHDLLNEVNRQDVFNDIDYWLKQNIK